MPAPRRGLRYPGLRRDRARRLRHARMAVRPDRRSPAGGARAPARGRTVTFPLRLCVIALLLSATACSTMGSARTEKAAGMAIAARDDTVQCTRADRCAAPSELRGLAGTAFAESAAAGPDAPPRHYALILDEGGDA